MKPTRNLLLRGVLGCSMLWLGACAMQVHAAGAQPTSVASVTLERSTCFGNCPAYSVTVTADGKTTFVGRTFVQTRSASAQATPAQVAAIQAALVRADVGSMRSSYTSRADGCEMMMSDRPGIKITVVDASGTHSVDFYFGCRGPMAEAVRPRIEQLAASIDEQLDTRRWIGTPTAPGVADHVER